MLDINWCIEKYMVPFKETIFTFTKVLSIRSFYPLKNKKQEGSSSKPRNFYSKRFFFISKNKRDILDNTIWTFSKVFSKSVIKNNRDILNEQNTSA